jgi:hypothetical protein
MLSIAPDCINRYTVIFDTRILAAISATVRRSVVIDVFCAMTTPAPRIVCHVGHSLNTELFLLVTHE